MSTTFTDPSLQQDFESYFKNLVDERIKAANPNAPPVAAQPVQGPIEIPLNGQNYKFNSPQEAGDAIQKAFLAQQEAARQAIAQVQAATANQPTDTTPVVEETFDENKYMKLMADNKFVDAAEYLDSFRPSQQDLRSKVEETNQLKQTLAAYQFKEAHPEYVGSPRNAAVIRGILDQSGMDVTPQNLEMAYALAKERRLVDMPQAQPQVYDPRLVAAQQAQWAAQQAQQVAGRNNPYDVRNTPNNPYDPSLFNNPAAPPNTGFPTLNRTGYAATPNIEDWANDPTTSAEDIEKFIKRQSGGR